jgi:hypothetical protein
MNAYQRASMTAGARLGDLPLRTPFSITGDVFLTELRRVKAAVDATALDFDRGAALLSPAFKTGWSQFVMRFDLFRRQNESYFGGPLGTHVPFSQATYEEVLDFERELGTWRQTFRRLGGTTSSPDPTPSTTTPGYQPEAEKKGIGAFWWGLLIVGGIVAVGYTARGLRGRGE